SKPQNDENDKPDTLKPGDTIEFDFG
ncbi:MAG: hypothetical protein RL757_2978, partial [Bacteroidota bacterium]